VHRQLFVWKGFSAYLKDEQGGAMAVVGDEYDQVSKAGGGHFFARHPVYGCHPVKQDLL